MTPLRNTIRDAKSMSDFGAKPATDAGGPSVSIGPGIGFSGKIEGADSLHVETKVDLNVKCRVLVVMDAGQYSGAVEADIVEVRGRFDGNLVARKRLIVHDQGVVAGTIKYAQIEVARGGSLTGNFEVLSA